MAEQINRSLPSPLLVPTLCWCLGICLAIILPLSYLWIAIIGIVCITLGLVFRFRMPVLMLMIMGAGFIRMAIPVNKPVTAAQSILSEKESVVQTCTGVVLKVLNPNNNFYLIRLTSINGVKTKDKTMMIYPKVLKPGDKFKALARITARKPDPVLDGNSPYWKLKSRRTPMLLKTVYRLDNAGKAAWINPERWRYELLHKLESKLGDAAPFAKALLLNDRTEDRNWIQQLVQGGLLHLIAISGLHVLLFYMVIVTLLNLFLPKRLAEVIFLVLMIVYAGLCQWSAPVLRAIIMILLYLFAKWLQRPVAPLQIICLSLLIITLIDPIQLFSVGLQLSYLCVITLVFLVPKRLSIPAGLPIWKRSFVKTRNALLDTLIISTIVSIVMLPIMLFYFYRGSLNGIVGNLLGIPLIGFLLPLTMALVLMPADWMLFHWLKAGFDILLYLFQKWVAFTAKLPFYIDTVILPLPLLIVCYLVIIAVIIRIKHGTKYRRISYALLALAIPLVIYAQFPVRKPFTLTAFNAGQGDCLLVEYPQGQTLMIDTGPSAYNPSKPNSSWFEQKLNIWQKSNKVNKIDILVLTHLDNDHAGGLEEVFHDMRVRNLFISAHSAASEKWKSWEQSGLLKDTQIKVLEDTLSFMFAGSRISFLHPDKDFRSVSVNDNSLVLRLDYKDFSALFTGDISTEVEQRLLERIPEKLDTDWLKVPHHGSRSSSSMPFIRAVSPVQVCITAAHYNRFGFPHRETLNRYRNYGIEPVSAGDGSVVLSIR